MPTNQVCFVLSVSYFRAAKPFFSSEAECACCLLAEEISTEGSNFKNQQHSN